MQGLGKSNNLKQHVGKQEAQLPDGGREQWDTVRCVSGVLTQGPAAGMVWQSCDELKKCPLDNRASIFKHLASTFLVIKDTLREVGRQRQLQQHAWCGCAAETLLLQSGWGQSCLPVCLSACCIVTVNITAVAQLVP